jgi:antitoxin component HigA of HigAB toxin-antitoxin module
MDQNSLARADMVPMLHIHEHISEVHRGKKALSVAMVQRLRACFRVPGDVLLPPPRKRRPEASRGLTEVVSA